MAHIARPLRWAEALSNCDYEISIASSEAYRPLVESSGFHFVPVSGINPAWFAKTVDAAQPFYGLQTFKRHCAEDRATLATIKPDLIVGDFRHTLSVSARQAKIPYINITNSYWSRRASWPTALPEAPIVRKLGVKWAGHLIRPFLPIALQFNFFFMAIQLLPALTAGRFRLSRPCLDYRDLITDGDWVAFADSPEVTSLAEVRPHERYIGAMVWSARQQIPAWFHEPKTRAKSIWVTLGSSGDIGVLPSILKSLATLDVEIMVSSSGRSIDLSAFPTVKVAAMLPIDQVCQRADVVICNGGSPATYAALSFGKPVLGVVSNNDQLLNMALFEKHGLGILMRSWDLSADRLQDAISKLLFDPSIAESARAFGAKLRKNDVDETIRALTREALDAAITSTR